MSNITAVRPSVLSSTNATAKDLLASLGLAIPVVNSAIRGTATVVDDTIVVATAITGGARAWAEAGTVYNTHLVSEVKADIELASAISIDLRKKTLAAAKRANSATVKG